MLSESLRVPYRADDTIGTILVGSVLTLLSGLCVLLWAGLLVSALPFEPTLRNLVVALVAGTTATVVAFLPSLVIRGYLLSIVEAGIHDEPNASSFVQWGSLVRAGWKSTLVSAFYFLPGAVFCGLVVGGLAATVISPPGFEGAVQALTAIGILIAGFGLLGYGLVYLYVRPAARAVFAVTGSLRSAVGVRRVLRLAATPQYLSGWLIAMGLLVVGPTISVPLLVIAGLVGVLSPVLAVVLTLATILLSICLLFVSRVSAAWVTGRGAADGISELYSITLIMATDKRAVVATTKADSLSDTDRSQLAPPPVQTGRTVDTGSEPIPPTDRFAPSDSADGVDSDTGESIDWDPDIVTEWTDPDSETASKSTDHDPATDSETTDYESNDDPAESGTDDQSDAESGTDDQSDAEDSGFIWGIEDEE